MKKIYYLGFYDIKENEAEKRNIVLAAANKMSYIISALERADYSVEIISASWTLDSKAYDGKTVKLSNKSNLTLFKTLSWGNGVKRVLSRSFTRRKIKKYLIDNLNKDDTLIAYHSVAYADILLKAKKAKGFKLVLEAEEIYADVSGSESERKAEYGVFNAADAYIFPTELLNDKLNKHNKPFTVIYGTYQVEADRNCKFNDGKIHCVYAGTLDPRKGGAIAAVRAAGELTPDYVVHVLGIGGEAEIKKEIEQINKMGKGQAVFEGLLSGEEYIRFIQGCHIGLSTQNPNAQFNDTSFPSKVLSYLANGLRVVSCRIRVIETSAVYNLVNMYDENTPKAVAGAIKSVDITAEYDSRLLISELDKRFVKDITTLLGD